MAWAKLDDRFHDNRKIKRAWRRCPAAIGLHVLAITYCAGHLTDGFVDVDFVEERMPAKRSRERAIAVLVEVGLWSIADDSVLAGGPVVLAGGPGWFIHDFSDFNETRADAEAKRRSKSEAGKKGAAVLHGRDKDHGTDLAAARHPASSVLGGAMPNPAPDPTRPEPSTPSPPKGNRQRDRERFEDECGALAAEEFPDVVSAPQLVRMAIGNGASSRGEIRRYVEQWDPQARAVA